MFISQQFSCAPGPDQAVRHQVPSQTIQRSVLAYKCWPGYGRHLHMLALVGRCVDKGSTAGIGRPDRRLQHYQRETWFIQVYR